MEYFRKIPSILRCYVGKGRVWSDIWAKRLVVNLRSMKNQGKLRSGINTIELILLNIVYIDLAYVTWTKYSIRHLRSKIHKNVITQIPYPHNRILQIPYPPKSYTWYIPHVSIAKPCICWNYHSTYRSNAPSWLFKATTLFLLVSMGTALSKNLNLILLCSCSAIQFWDG